MMASVGCSIFGSGTVSTRTSWVPCQVTAFKGFLASVRVEAAAARALARKTGLPLLAPDIRALDEALPPH